MGKNLIPIIAKELGVEIGEKFEIDRIEGKFRFNQFRLQTEYQTGNSFEWVDASDVIYQVLLMGSCEIIKLPFEPHMNEYYWTYNGDDFGTVESYWLGHCIDYCKKACGCIFRTEADAIKARPQKYEELTGKEWGCEDG